MFLRLLSVSALSLAALCAAEPAHTHPLLGGVHKVYLLPMGGGLDQYIAHQLTAQGVLEVVTDPKLADAVLTESIGADFEARLNELLPAPLPPPTAKPVEAAKGKQSRDAEPPTVMTSAPRSSTFSRGRGNVFLVDLKSRSVVWSAHREPKNRTPVELDRTSSRFAEALAAGLERSK